MGRGERTIPCSIYKDDVDEVTEDHKFIAKSMRLSIIDWWHVAELYAPRVAIVALGGAGAVLWQPVIVPAIAAIPPMDGFVESLQQPWVVSVLILAALSIWVLLPKSKPDVYLMDFAVFEPPAAWRCTHDDLIEICRRTDAFSEENLAFMRRILDRSKTGQATHWPPGIVELLKSGKRDFSMTAAREESKTVMFSVFEEAIKRAGITAKDVDFLIVNCSLFSPTPSLAAMVHSEYGLRADCRTFNLGGMGCSASLIAVDLAKSLLHTRPGSRAVIISTENLTQQLYLGETRSMLVQNMLFRCGGAAVVLSNRIADAFRANYKLLLTHRTQCSDEEALECVWECEDEAGRRGVRLSKDVPKIAGKALKHNLTSIGPYVLPLREQAAVVFTEMKRFIQPRLNQLGEAIGWEYLKTLPRSGPYIPDFKTALEHFCIHAGGRAVIDGVGENLRLRPDQTVPSKATLHDFGNTSSSSVWYELRFCEQETPRWVGEGAGKPIVAGERVIQVAFGSGFKCNSAVWLRMR